MGDDSAGVEVVERLIRAGVEGCQFCFMPSGGVGLLEVFASADLVLFIDAVISGAAAGTIHLIPLPSPEVCPREIGSLSSHGWGLLETFELARALGRPVPRAMLLGVEIGEVAPGAGRSPAVARALSVIVERFSRLQSLLPESDSSVWRSALQFPPGDVSFPKEEQRRPVA
jgi:hydrogenase maturation protease